MDVNSTIVAGTVILVVLLALVGLAVFWSRQGDEITPVECEPEDDTESITDKFWANWKPQQDPSGHDQR